LTYPKALARLKSAHDFVRDAIHEDVEPRLRQLLDMSDAASSSNHTSTSR
jgi:hypothetical protein